MAFSYKTPGVYLEEIVKLPPSVASVETAIPCFFGVTQKATETTDKDLIGVSQKINSLADYEFYYGFADIAKAVAQINLNTLSTASLLELYTNNMYYSVKHYFDNGGGPCYIHSIGDYLRTNVDANTYKNELAKLDLDDEVTLVVLPDLIGLKSRDQSYDVYNNALQKASALQDKFVIIDVDQLKTNGKVKANDSKTAFRTAISNNTDAIKYGAAYFPFVQTTYNYDYNTASIQMNFSDDVKKIEVEVTINNAKTKVKPYTILNSLDYKLVNKIFLLNAAYNDLLKNIFIDTIPVEKTDSTISAINNKTTSIITFYDKQQVKIDDLVAKKEALLKPYASNAYSLDVVRNNTIVTASNAIVVAATTKEVAIPEANKAAEAAVNAANSAVEAASRVNDNANKLLADAAKVKADAAKVKALAADTLGKAQTASAEAATASTEAKTASDNVKTAINFSTLKDNYLKLITDEILEIYKSFPTKPQGVTNASYNELNNTFLIPINSFFNSAFEAKLKEAFLNIALYLPPSPAIAGVYASVDRNRGVWKAPANVSLNAVIKPEVLLSDLDQEDFNVDAENGKSINCIRQFVGRGNLVWGARTLAGNNNEWKYVNVRRFFNMVEESCQNAARQFVFEPNDANTWVRVKGMIDNYLTNLWRVGALQGAKPDQAFYVSVGLNQTMTADDILNGLLIVEIGLAVVRPAEFIVLRFSHKLAVS